MTGSYAFIIFFVSTVWRHCDLGPFHYGELEADQCSKTPWTNLLYVNNFDLKYIEDRGSVSQFSSSICTLSFGTYSEFSIISTLLINDSALDF